MPGRPGWAPCTSSPSTPPWRSSPTPSATPPPPSPTTPLRPRPATPSTSRPSAPPRKSSRQSDPSPEAYSSSFNTSRYRSAEQAVRGAALSIRVRARRRSGCSGELRTLGSSVTTRPRPAARIHHAAPGPAGATRREIPDDDGPVGRGPLRRRARAGPGRARPDSRPTGHWHRARARRRRADARSTVTTRRTGRPAPNRPAPLPCRRRQQADVLVLRRPALLLWPLVGGFPRRPGLGGRPPIRSPWPT